MRLFASRVKAELHPTSQTPSMISQISALLRLQYFVVRGLESRHDKIACGFGFQRQSKGAMSLPHGCLAKDTLP